MGKSHATSEALGFRYIRLTIGFYLNEFFPEAGALGVRALLLTNSDHKRGSWSIHRITPRLPSIGLPYNGYTVVTKATKEFIDAGPGPPEAEGKT